MAFPELPSSELAHDQGTGGEESGKEAHLGDSDAFQTATQWPEPGFLPLPDDEPSIRPTIGKPEHEGREILQVPPITEDQRFTFYLSSFTLGASSTGNLSPEAERAQEPMYSLPMGSGQQRNEHAVERMVERYYAGQTLKDIAQELGVSMYAVKRGLQEASRAPISREAAKNFVEAYYMRKWNRRREGKVMGRVIDEVNRLDRLYPGLADEVYTEIKKRLSEEGPQT